MSKFDLLHNTCLVRQYVLLQQFGLPTEHRHVYGLLANAVCSTNMPQ